MQEENIGENLTKVLSTINVTAEACGREPQEVRLVAVSKKFPAEAIRTACQSGQFLFGENYIQELQQKSPLLPAEAKVHFIGHLQSNKAKVAAQLCNMVETVDNARVAAELNRHLTKLGKQLEILVQVNIGKDEKKSGISAEETEPFLEHLQSYSMLSVRGLMTIPPFSSNPEESRHYFRKLKELSVTLQDKDLFCPNKPVELSMGMSHDYTIAIQEGATLVRIGTAIFGKRQQPST